jgi:hypothetical protein
MSSKVYFHWNCIDAIMEFIQYVESDVCWCQKVCKEVNCLVLLIYNHLFCRKEKRVVGFFIERCKLKTTSNTEI